MSLKMPIPDDAHTNERTTTLTTPAAHTHDLDPEYTPSAQPAAPTALLPMHALHLQRAIGNHAVGRMVAGTILQRHLAEAQAYVAANGLGLVLPPFGARPHVLNYVTDFANPQPHRIGLRNAWNAPNAAGVAPPAHQQIPLPDDLAAPVGAPAQQAARLILFNNWIGGNINGTERNIAQQFGAPGGPAPAAANLAPIATQNTSAAIGHDGGGFGFTLQAFIAANIPPPLYLSAWLWNRGQAWSPQLNERFVFDVLNTAAITDVHLVSPYFVGILNGVGVNNLAAQRVAMNGAGNAQVAREIRQLINAGVLSFTWNGATLHQVHVPPRLTRPLATEYTPRNTTPAPLCKRKSGRCVWIQLCKEYTTHASIADACCRSHVPAGSA